MLLIRRETIGWALGEIAVVVIGILIAFLLNAWWVQRGELAVERAHLRALVSDFEWNTGALPQFIERQDRVSRASVDLLELARTEPSAAAARVRPLLSQVLSSGRFEPVMGAYNALLNSAGLSLIRNGELRAALATFAARVEGRYSERFSDEIYLTLIRDFTGRLGFADAMLETEDPSVSFASLLMDPRFQEHLALRHATEREVAGQYRQLLNDAQSILEQLRGELR